MAEFTFKMDLVDVDWDELKRTLQADDFDNGRSPAQLAASFGNSAVTVIAYAGGSIAGTARALSDGVCNAYIVDVWTLTAYRQQGVARAMLDRLAERLPGQHIFLWTDSAAEFYRKTDFQETDYIGFERVVGEWLDNRPGDSKTAVSNVSPASGS